MTYNPNIPQPTDLLSNSQGQILANFNKANSSFGINHYPFDNGTVNNGKHLKVELPTTGAPGSVASELVLFSGTTPSLRTALFYQRDNSGTGPFQLTGIDPLNATSGYTFLPGSLLIQWGQVSPPGSGGTVIFPIPFDGVTPPYSLTFGLGILGASSAHAAWVDTGQTFDNTKFTYKIDVTIGAPGYLFWMAIGSKI